MFVRACIYMSLLGVLLSACGDVSLLNFTSIERHLKNYTVSKHNYWVTATIVRFFPSACPGAPCSLSCAPIDQISITLAQYGASLFPPCFFFPSILMYRCLASFRCFAWCVCSMSVADPFADLISCFSIHTSSRSIFSQIVTQFRLCRDWS